MSQVSKKIISKDLENRIFALLVDCIKETKQKQETAEFLDDLFTRVERTMMAKRLAIAILLLENKHTQTQIANYLKVSTSTVTRINREITYSGDGLKLILKRIKKKKEFIKIIKELYIDLSTMKGKGRNWSRIGKKKYQAKKDLDQPF